MDKCGKEQLAACVIAFVHVWYMRLRQSNKKRNRRTQDNLTHAVQYTCRCKHTTKVGELLNMLRLLVKVVQSTRQSHLTCILCLIQHASLKLYIVNLSTILIPYSVRVYPKVSYSYTVHTGTYRCIYIHASKASWT